MSAGEFTTPVYYNDIESFVCDWTENLIDANCLPAGSVDRHSITEVTPDDLVGYGWCSFFNGIGGWVLAARLAGWPRDVPLWMASLPCQPFSMAGKRKGKDDERHLWPEFFRLVRECSPWCIVGEQVSGADGYEWLDGIRRDLEGEGYALGAMDLQAAGQGAPHKRQRLYWCARKLGDTNVPRIAGRASQPSDNGSQLTSPERTGDTVHPMADALYAKRRPKWAEHGGGSRRPFSSPGIDAEDSELAYLPEQRRGRSGSASQAIEWAIEPGRPCSTGELADSQGGGRQECSLPVRSARQGQAEAVKSGSDGRLPDWRHSRPILCKDDKARFVPLEPEFFPLAHGLPRDMGLLLTFLRGVGLDEQGARKILRHAGKGRTGRLKGYGNAIVPAVAVAFLKAVMAELGVVNSPGE